MGPTRRGARMSLSSIGAAASLDADYNVASSVSRRSTVNASWHQITSPRFGDKWMAPERPLKLGKIVAFNVVPQALW